jgi:hypothetical protein
MSALIFFPVLLFLVLDWSSVHSFPSPANEFKAWSRCARARFSIARSSTSSAGIVFLQSACNRMTQPTLRLRQFSLRSNGIDTDDDALTANGEKPSDAKRSIESEAAESSGFTLPFVEKTKAFWKKYGKLYFTIWFTIYLSAFPFIYYAVSHDVLNTAQ